MSTPDTTVERTDTGALAADLGVAATGDTTLEQALADLAATDQAAAQSSPAGSFYQHLDSQQITVYVPPSSSRQEWQVRGVEPNSGIVFLSFINDAAFHQAGYVKTRMTHLGHALYLESLVANVAGIAVAQRQDAQNQLVNELNVTVTSSSGNSQGIITVPYPKTNDISGSVAAFTALVNAEVKLLDSNEAS